MKEKAPDRRDWAMRRVKGLRKQVRGFEQLAPIAGVKSGPATVESEIISQETKSSVGGVVNISRR
jgi:hypothetical protein